MKTLKALAITAITILGVLSTSCKETNDEPPFSQTTNPDQETSGDNEIEEDKTEKTRYYVKYEVHVTDAWAFIKNIITYQTDTGIKSASITGNTSWSATYGPLDYGQTVSLKINRDGSYSDVGINNARISVSKNSEPFTIKAEDAGDKNISLTYKIDF